MNMTILHPYHGITLGEWIKNKPSELEEDAIALFHIVLDMRDSFGLTGPSLDEAVRLSLVAILSSGAYPVIGVKGDTGWWRWVRRYGTEPLNIANAIIDEWHERGRDPHCGDVWFALPEDIEPDARPPERERL